MVSTERQKKQFSMRLKFKIQNLAEEIRKRMFVFEDIVTLDNRSIQRVVRDCENEDLILSLKVSSEEVKEVLFRNMSQRMAESFQEEMDIMGPVRLRDVEEAQTRIVSIIRRLEDSVKSSLHVAEEMTSLSKIFRSCNTILKKVKR